jgi:hypothetical protein
MWGWFIIGDPPKSESTMLRKLLLTVFLLALIPMSHAHEEHTHAHGAKQGLAVSADFDAAGRLWRASVENGRVLVSHSDDQGKTFSAPVAVNAAPEKVGGDGELRPKIAFGPQGQIYVSWTQALDKPYAGYIRFSRSIDGGKTFSKPIVVHHHRDVITHRFDALAVAVDGTIYVAWIDKRDLQTAKKSGKKYEGAAVYAAVSRDGGTSFGKEFKVADHTCECCRIALATELSGTAVLMWRHVFEGGMRDHAMARIGPQGVLHEPVRATFGNWKIDACPHHGPAIARGGDWGWHLAWYDGNEKKPGLYVARMDGTAWVASPARRVGNTEAQAGHPSLYAQGERVWLLWKELTETQAVIFAQESDDGGRSWGEPRKLAETAGAADNPFLVSDGKMVYLSWNTRQDGYRLVEVGSVR